MRLLHKPLDILCQRNSIMSYVENVLVEIVMFVCIEIQIELS